MASAAVARPAQALRQRRDAPRPHVAKRSATVALSADAVADGAPTKKRKLAEPYVRDSDYILKKHGHKPPSITLHLHPTHFRFDGQDSSWGYDSTMKFILEHLRTQTVPHQMLDEILSQGVPFYDGCLIVKVHNHRGSGKEGRGREAGKGADTDRFSMHAYNEHVTPSPMVPYPKKAAEAMGKKGDVSGEKTAAAMGKDKESDGVKIYSLVLHPTPLAQHQEMLLLANTPMSEVMKIKKKNGESSTQPPTPSLPLPPTPSSATRNPGAFQRMCLEPEDFHTFQSDYLLATEPPLYLGPAHNAAESDAIIKMLTPSNQTHAAPLPRSRKRTTAEMAADDAQAAEAERRMLIMDERIKPAPRTGAGNANDNIAATTSLASRFKTLDMVRQKHEESERAKKEEEARERRNAGDEHNAQQVKQRNRELLVQQHAKQVQAQQQKAEQMRQTQLAQVQMNGHAHPNAQAPTQQQAAAMIAQQHAQQQASLQHHAQQQQHQMVQNSPQVGTPMMSSPMLPNGAGFPMTRVTSQGAGAGSPPGRPPSAALHVRNGNNGMVRQVSQQTHGSQHNTPVIQQGTPSMVPVMPNRQMASTPRIPSGSPATMHMQQQQSTPTSASMMGGVQGTPRLQTHSMNPDQAAIMRQREAASLMARQQQQAVMQAQNPMQGYNQAHGQMQPHNGDGANMTPQQISLIRQNQTSQQQRAMIMQAQMLQGQSAQAPGGNAQEVMGLQQQQAQRNLMQMRIQQQQNQQAQSRHLQSQMLMQQQPNAQHPGQQPTPQMPHAHPSGTPNQGQAARMMPQTPNAATPDQVAAAHQKSQQIALHRHNVGLLNPVINGYGGVGKVPQEVVNSWAPAMQMTYRTMVSQFRNRLIQQQQQNGQMTPQMQQQLLQRQMLAQQNSISGAGMGMGMDGAGGGPPRVVPGGQPDPQYMMQLRQQQQMLRQQQMQAQAQNGGMPQQGFAQAQQQQQQDPLNQHFVNMTNALQRPGQGGGQMG